MHNLHYLVTRAENPEEACSQVESEIYEWGTENNWRTICGCISEDNVIHSTGQGRWKPTETDTLEKINLQVTKWMNDDEYNKKTFDKCSSGQDENSFEWYGAMKYCEQQFQSTRKAEKFPRVVHQTHRHSERKTWPKCLQS